MSEYFYRLFAYDLWANRRVYASVAELKESPAKAVEWLGHIMHTQQFVYEVLNGRDGSYLNDAPDLTLAESLEWIERLGKQWPEYLAARTEEELAGDIEFRNSRGAMDKRRVLDLLFHAINHSTYHRAQIALSVREAGGSPAVTEFTAFVREQSK